ncbi:hypothetical protein CCHR01_09751 [Colletotrichum chrysophilum]|uniref:C2H2-type domain-containing protein n=1 Tax=Colletotrichum chrysophilum TaxID=1836956 RepID=A0AAD9AH55_9PEZI|nr:hypothetical protein CCHR01_09751 [Colletotrichum chrysophilum]
MEAAVSIVDIVSSADQILNGLVKLHELIQGHQESVTRADNAIRETALLKSTIIELKSNLEALRDNGFADSSLPCSSLVAVVQTHVEGCGRDIEDWVDGQILPEGPSSKRQKIGDVFSNRRIRSVRDLESKLLSYRSQLNWDIGAMNISMSHGGLEKFHRIQVDAQGLTESNLRFNAQTEEHMNGVLTDSAIRNHALVEHISMASEGQKRHATMMQEENQNRISRMSDKIPSTASVASSLQQLIKSSSLQRSTSESEYSANFLISSPPEPISGRRKRRFSRIEDETSEVRPRFSFTETFFRGTWSCGALVGIDQAFNREYDQISFICLFCDKPFHKNDFLERAKHLVDRHKFSECDQSMVYTASEDFKSHLESNHSASREILNAENFDLSLFVTKFRISTDRRQLMLGGNPQPADIPTTHVLLNSQLSSLLSRTPYLEYDSCESGVISADSQVINRAMEALAKDVFSRHVSSPELPGILYQAANLEQELIIQSNRPFQGRWAPVPDCLMRASSPSQLRAMLNRTTKEVLRSSLHHLLWPTGSGTAIFRQSQLCTECVREKVSNHRECGANVSMLCKRHHEEVLGSVYPRSTWKWFSLDHTLKVSALFVKLKKWTTPRERIELWMLDVLHKSDHLVAMLRCNAFSGILAGSSAFPDGKPDNCLTEHKPDFWGTQWTHDLLATFDKNIEPFHFGPIGEESEGAVDSREGDNEFCVPFRLKLSGPLHSNMQVS